MDFPKSALERLTNTERAVLELVSRYYTNGEIARQLGVRESTVRTHVEHILEKLGVTSRREAARLWTEATRRGGRPSSF